MELNNLPKNPNHIWTEKIAQRSQEKFLDFVDLKKK